MFKRFLILITLILYQTGAQSKTSKDNNFNQKYLSNYFSALISYNSTEKEESLKYFNLSKNLVTHHSNYLQNYIMALVENGKVNRAVKEVNKYKGGDSLNFFEAKILLIAESISEQNYEYTKILAEELSLTEENDSFEMIMTGILQNYTKLFLEKKIQKPKKDYGRLTLVTTAFQECYLNISKSNKYFLKLVNDDKGDYSRYLFFYLGNLINLGDTFSASQISSKINYIDTNLLVSQSKNWIEKNEFSKFSQYFSCKNEKDILAEFFYLVSNLYSSQESFDKSNFYLQISNFLNKKFYFNSTLLAENYFLNQNYKKSYQILDKLNNNDQVYLWYKIKKKAQIISIQENENDALQYIEKNIKKFQKLNYKIFYDLANIYKNFKNYEKSIEYYNLVLNSVDKTSSSYADTLYRRGSSYERIGDFKKSDEDLLESLSIVNNDPYVLNYLAYSWLERNYKVETAIEMLMTAYNKKSNDPYITDSLGWAYYKNGDYIEAEKYLNYAIQLKPNDPVIIDHYADTLWKLDRKIQARYYWKSIVESKSNEIDKKFIKKKITMGPNII